MTEKESTGGFSVLEEASSSSLSPALEKVSQNGTISPSLPLLFPPRESRRSPALLRQTRCRLLLPPPLPPTICGTVPVRCRPSPRSLKASWPPPPPFPPTLGIARPTPLPPLPADPHSAHSARPKSGEGESMPRSDCLPEPGSPLRSSAESAPYARLTPPRRET